MWKHVIQIIGWLESSFTSQLLALNLSVWIFFSNDDVPQYQYRLLNGFSWSPCTKYVLAQEGGTGGDLVSGPEGQKNILYAIPSENRDVEVTYDGNGDVICVKTYLINPVP